MGIDADDLDEATRASANGQVAASITYQEWLRSQERGVVEDALGVTRAKLFIDGDLELSSFVTDRRKELTLSQIRKREASAFARAGV
jgi:hypothetical protein